MSGIEIGMQQGDGDGLHTRHPRRLHVHPGLRHIQSGQDLPLRIQALRHFHNGLIQQFRPFDMPGKQIRPCLIANFQQIAKPFGNHQQNSSPFALQ